MAAPRATWGCTSVSNDGAWHSAAGKSLLHNGLRTHGFFWSEALLDQPMNADELAAQAVSDLEPLLAARAAVGKPPSRRRKKGGRQSPGNQCWIWVSPDQEVTFRRSLPLTVWEAAILEPYGNALAELNGVPAGVARIAADDVVVRAIAGQLGGPSPATVEECIRFLLRAAARTYEGQSMSLNLLVDLGEEVPLAAMDTLRELEEHDWYALLGGGLHTGLLLDLRGRVVNVVDVQQPPGAASANELAPVALGGFGAWTSAGDPGTRIALSLTRNREIAIQQQGVMRYVFRSGRWKALPLDVALRSSWSAGAGVRNEMKRAVLASAIDASLRHHGACISVVTSGHRKAFDASGAVMDGDRWPSNVRADLFDATTFQALSRWQRLELLSMDGATVLGHRGEILAAGAIVSVPGGSTGGGRLAAAKELARFGAAIKVSQDGPIKVFGLDAAGAVETKFDLA